MGFEDGIKFQKGYSEKEFKKWNRKRILGTIFIGIIIVLAIIGLGVVISLIGSNIFPDWWNKPLGLNYTQMGV